jgi:Outer membrane protein beta-barrel domain
MCVRLALAAMLALSTAGTAVGSAQSSRAFAVEARGTAVIPTFDIADVAEVGWGGGLGIGYSVSPRVRLMADFDLGVHGTDQSGFNINTYHYVGKIGYDLVNTDRVVVTANLGVGAVTFGGDLAESKTYPAINAGAKIGIKIAPAIELLISPQGDIAFTKEADLGTTNAWVWPVGLGFRLKI